MGASPAASGAWFAVAAAPASDAWAVGSDGSGQPLIEHWNGTRWTRASLLSPG